MAHLALFFQFGQRAPALFNIGVGERPVDLVQVNGIDIESLQAGFDLPANRVGLEAVTHNATLIPDLRALGEDVWALASFDGFANYHLRVTQAIDGSGIDPVDAQIQRTLNRLDRLLVILWSPAMCSMIATYRPGSQANRCNLHTCLAKLFCLHGSIPFSSVCFDLLLA